MDDNKILKLKEPTAELDGANKHYVDCVNTETRNSFEARLLSAHLTSNTIANVFKYLLDPNELSSERDIIVNGLVDFDLSPHSNKKAYDIDLVYQSGTQSYNSKIGVNLYPLPLGNYTLVMEYYFPENIGISLVAQATKVHMAKQTRESFPNYKKIIVQFTKTSIFLSDYMYFFIRGQGTTSTNPESYLIFYGVKSLKDVVPPNIYSHPLNSGMFLYSDDKMKMNMDLDLNGHALVGVQNSFFIPGWYDYTKDSHIIYLNSVSEHQIIPFDCVLKKIVFTFTAIIPSLRLGIDVTRLGSFFQQFPASIYAQKAEIDLNVIITQNDLLKIRFSASNNNAHLSQIDKAVFVFQFTS